MAKLSNSTPVPSKGQGAQVVKSLVPINYDHERREPGETFEVRNEDLDQLLQVNAVELVDSGTSAAQ